MLAFELCSMADADRLTTVFEATETSFADEQWAAFVQASPRGGSGDCARIVPRRDGRALFFIGDVAGHDPRAVALAGDLDARISHLARWASPGALLEELNTAVEAGWPSDTFVSAICFLLDPLTGRGIIAVAGQVPPVIKSDSGCRTVEVSTAPALGLVADQGYPERAFMLEAGDVLVAVTDGITDPFATGGDLLGLGELARLLHGSPIDPAAICASLLGATRRCGLQDDATVLAVAPRLTRRRRRCRAAPAEMSLTV